MTHATSRLTRARRKRVPDRSIQVLKKLWQEVLKQIKAGSLSLEDLRCFLQLSANDRKQLLSLRLSQGSDDDVFRVDYRAQAIQGLIKKGSYDLNVSGIDWSAVGVKFRARQKVQFRLEEITQGQTILHLKHVMRKKGFRLGELSDLLTLGAKFPDLQRAQCIIALGTEIEGGSHPCLDAVSTDRRLGITSNLANKNILFVGIPTNK